MKHDDSKPFVFRKPGESQEDAAERISKELQEAADREEVEAEPPHETETGEA